MPVYLFTFHAHGSWMPDRKQGYVQRKRGILPRDHDMAEAYRRRTQAPDISFSPKLRRRLIAIVHEAAGYQSLRVYGIATDPTHLHVLVSWDDTRPPTSVRGNLKSSMTRRLNESHGRQVWFSRGGSRKQVEARDHFDHLLGAYLPKHVGPNWVAQDEQN